MSLAFKHLRETHKIFDERINLFIRKGIYPYDYVDNSTGYLKHNYLQRKLFCNKLNNEDISDEDYGHVQKVWEAFDCKTLKDYHNIYLISDVLLLTDIFEIFCDLCFENYGLDSAWYYTAPGLVWDTALEKTKVELELLADIDMLLMVERGIRGGVSTIITRHGEPNNKYMGQDFNPKELIKYLIYLDAKQPLQLGYAKNLYLQRDSSGWQKVNSEIENVTVVFQEVDLEYPKELHDIHNEYLLPPETYSK